MQQPHPVLQSFDYLHSSYKTPYLIYILITYGRHHLMCLHIVIPWCIFSAIISGFPDVKLMKRYNNSANSFGRLSDAHMVTCTDMIRCNCSRVELLYKLKIGDKSGFYFTQTNAGVSWLSNISNKSMQ